MSVLMLLNPATAVIGGIGATLGGIDFVSGMVSQAVRMENEKNSVRNGF